MESNQWRYYLEFNFFSGISLANYFVYSFKGNGIILDDILAITTALNVAEGYKFFIDIKIFVYLLLIVFVVLFVLCLNRKFEYQHKGLTFKYRLSLLFSVSVMIYGIVFTPVLKDNGINIHTFSNKYGLVLDIVAQLEDRVINRVEPGTTVETVQKYDLLYQSDSVDKNIKYPNVIVIMNESFSFIDQLTQLPTNKEVTPFYHSLTENTIKGNVVVSVNGAGTPNSEFEFILGDSMMNYNGYPYNSISRNEPISSFASQMKDLGLTSTFMHPFYSNGWNRVNVYTAMMFDYQKYLESFELEMMRTFPNDRCDYKELINTLKSTEDRDFIFNVTVQNHGGYSDATLNGFEKTIFFEGLQGKYPEAETYLSLMNESDKAFEELITYLKDYDEPVILCMYGDHQPGFSAELFENLGISLEDENKLMPYVTPFVIWTNYDIEEKDAGTMSLNYLSSYLLNSLDLPLTKYNQYLLDLYEQYPIISKYGVIDANGNYSELVDDEAIFDYKTIMNNHMKDLKYTIHSFFNYE